MIKPHVKGHLVCQNPNQTRTNLPTQGASSVSLSPIVSYLKKCGAWCGFSNVNKPTVLKKAQKARIHRYLKDILLKIVKINQDIARNTEITEII